MTMEQQEEYFATHAALINKLVRSFMDKGKHCPVRISYDDLYQSVCVALLEHLTRCETEEQAQAFPFYDVLHAMTLEVMRSVPLTGQRQTRKMRELLQAQPVIVDLEHANGITKTWLADTITKNDFYLFYDRLDSKMQNLVLMRLSGASVCEVSHTEKVNRDTIYKRMKKLRKQYGEQMN